MYYVYLLKSLKKNWNYIGCTDDLKKRFSQHQSGLVKSTKSNSPFKLVYYEAYENKTDARSREVSLKKHTQTKEKLYEQIKQSLI